MERENISDELRWAVLKRDRYMCRYCGTTDGPFHLDHVYPISKGGETTIDNLVTSCPECNRSKRARVGVWPYPLTFEPPKRKLNYHLVFAGLFMAMACALVTIPLLVEREDYRQLLFWAVLGLVAAFVATLNGIRKFVK